MCACWKGEIVEEEDIKHCPAAIFPFFYFLWLSWQSFTLSLYTWEKEYGRGECNQKSKTDSEKKYGVAKSILQTKQVFLLFCIELMKVDSYFRSKYCPVLSFRIILNKKKMSLLYSFKIDLLTFHYKSVLKCHLCGLCDQKMRHTNKLNSFVLSGLISYWRCVSKVVFSFPWNTLWESCSWVTVKSWCILPA